jgi:hypothetical protein
MMRDEFLVMALWKLFHFEPRVTRALQSCEDVGIDFVS